MRSIVFLAFVALVGAHPQKRQIQGIYPGGENPLTQELAQKLPFFQGVPNQGRQEFFSIIYDMNSPRGTVETNLDNWARKYNVQNQWTTFKTQFTAQRAELISSLRTFVGQLPAAFDKLIQMDDDKSLSGNDMIQGAGQIFNSLTEKVGNAIGQFTEFLFGDKNNSTQVEGGNPGSGMGGGVFPGNGQNGNNNGGFPGNNNGNNNNGGFPGNNNGGFPGINNGGMTGGNQNGGFPGNNNGGQFGGNGAFPGNNNGGFLGGNQNGGFPGNNNGNNNNGGGFPEVNGQFGGNGGFPGNTGRQGQFGGNNNNNQFGGFQIPGGQNNNGRPMGGSSGQFTQNGFARF